MPPTKQTSVKFHDFAAELYLRQFSTNLSNLAILLILIEKNVKGSVDCNFRITTGRKIA